MGYITQVWVIHNDTRMNTTVYPLPAPMWLPLPSAEVMYPLAFVRLSICLLVCLFVCDQRNSKTYGWIFTRCPQMWRCKCHCCLFKATLKFMGPVAWRRSASAILLFHHFWHRRLTKFALILNKFINSYFLIHIWSLKSAHKCDVYA